MSQYTDILSDETYLELQSQVPLSFHYGDNRAYLDHISWEIEMSPKGLKRLMLKAVVPALSEAIVLKTLLTSAIDYEVLQAHFATDLSYVSLVFMGKPEVFLPLVADFATLSTAEDVLAIPQLQTVFLDLNAYQLLELNISSSGE